MLSIVALSIDRGLATLVREDDGDRVEGVPGNCPSAASIDLD